uniref:Coiled-coil domain-containing protein 25 n=1 Tax=Strigamia maritima TaxID=126957 RepID=T1II61_STRMM
MVVSKTLRSSRADPTKKVGKAVAKRGDVRKNCEIAESRGSPSAGPSVRSGWGSLRRETVKEMFLEDVELFVDVVGVPDWASGNEMRVVLKRVQLTFFMFRRNSLHHDYRHATGGFCQYSRRFIISISGTISLRIGKQPQKIGLSIGIDVTLSGLQIANGWIKISRVKHVVSPPVKIFMGVDKFENEGLIKWGWPEDVWFHVDKLSSAHVYLRLQPGQSIDDIPAAVLEDCAQLVKANSIQGNKMNNIEVVYTMWANLKKTAGMEVGQVGFYKDKEVMKIKVEKRINEVINRLNKTKEEKNADLQAERECRDRLEREDKKRLLREQKERSKDDEKKRREQAELRSYSSLMSEDKMRSNLENDEDSDEFM